MSFTKILLEIFSITNAHIKSTDERPNESKTVQHKLRHAIELKAPMQSSAGWGRPGMQTPTV